MTTKPVIHPGTRLEFRWRFYKGSGTPTEHPHDCVITGDVKRTMIQQWCCNCGEPILRGERSWADRNSCYRVCTACVALCHAPDLGPCPACGTPAERYDGHVCEDVAV